MYPSTTFLACPTGNFSGEEEAMNCAVCHRAEIRSGANKRGAGERPAGPNEDVSHVDVFAEIQATQTGGGGEWPLGSGVTSRLDL